MIVPLLKGGLCNQMFQIAACAAYATHTEQQYAINYNLPFSAHQGKHPSSYRDTVYRNIRGTDLVPQMTYKQEAFGYSDIPFYTDVILDGYFQSQKYFSKYSHHIQSLFDLTTAKTTAINKKIKDLHRPVCAVHIRRGDYLQTEFAKIHHICNTDYYKRCISYIPSDTTLIVVTDDVHHVLAEFKAEFETGRMILANTQSEIDDLYILTQADFIIGCNSTFSWWGTYLNNKKQKCLFPEKWFTDVGIQTVGTTDLLQDYMTLISV